MAAAGVLAEGSGFDAYLKLDGIRGDVTDAHHQDWIRVSGFRDAVAMGPTGQSPAFDGLCLVKATDRATPLLLQQCASGTSLPRARLELVTVGGGRFRFYQITLHDVWILSVQVSGIAGDPVSPTNEDVCLAFSGIEWTYTEFDQSGLPATEIRAWWDLAVDSGGVETVPVFKVTGVKTAASGLELTWPARAGRTYRILGSPIVTGPYEPVRTVAPEESGPATLLLPFTSERSFFTVEESE